MLAALSCDAEAGSISASSYTAQVCENTACTVTSTSPVNFGVFATTPASNVTVTDTALSGFIWGKSFGWAVLNCGNTTSGCISANANFKVSNDGQGHLSGYAWGETSGWINFGPFSNSVTSPVSINSSGQFNGYAWTENHGWIKFDCSNPSYCVTTDWRPQTLSSGGGSSGCTGPNCPSFCIRNPTAPSCTGVSHCSLYPTDPVCILPPPACVGSSCNLESPIPVCVGAECLSLPPSISVSLAPPSKPYEGSYKPESHIIKGERYIDAHIKSFLDWLIDLFKRAFIPADVSFALISALTLLFLFIIKKKNDLS